MACANCGTSKDGKPGGCNSNGGCSTGGCNRMNTYDWLATKDIRDANPFEVVEVSFSNGSRKDFFNNPPFTQSVTGDMVVVESGAGYDVGKISLSGELVRMQMKKKKADLKNVQHKVIRRANHRDLDKLSEARQMEKKTLVRARAIARTLGLDMKMGDVEYQGDKRKATFFYTADGRIDFRELIRHFAKEFKVKIEMRQIGARQESARIGGIGSCGRELCCSTWLSDFKSVSTAAARYQNLAINQTKLSGQCGRLKCCLNYELDSYMDALQKFPKSADKLRTEVGQAVLVKTDIFKGLMFYAYMDKGNRGKFYPLSVDKVKEIKEMNAKGEVPADLVDLSILLGVDGEDEIGFDEELTGIIELPEEKRRRKKRNRNKNRGRRPDERGRNRKPKPKSKTGDEKKKEKEKKDGGRGGQGGSNQNKKKNNRNRNRNRNNRRKKPNPNKGGDKPGGGGTDKKKD